MFSRLLTTTAARRLPSVVSKQSFSTAAAAATPTVFDLLISITIVDPSGARRKIKGRIGE